MAPMIAYTGSNGKVVIESIDDRQPQQLYIDRFIDLGFPDAIIINELPSIVEACRIIGGELVLDPEDEYQFYISKIRREREKFFRETDKLWIEYMSKGLDTTEIEDRQSYLRNITDELTLEQARELEIELWCPLPENERFKKLNVNEEQKR